jgi:hypothetical protein
VALNLGLGGGESSLDLRQRHLLACLDLRAEERLEQLLLE